MILLLGPTGHLGQAFAAELRKRAVPFAPLSRKRLDYTQFDALFNYVRSTKPSFIINAAGYPGRPSIDDCEVHRTETVQANTLLPQTVARVCYLTNTPWGHVSSGGIFSGAHLADNGASRIERDLNQPELRRLLETEPDRFGGFVESDTPNFSFRSPPCSFYSGTKALAEEALGWFDQSYIWRPGLIFDGFDHYRNLLTRMLHSSKVHDGVNSLSHRSDFVSACLDLWESHAPFGAYHVVNPGAVTGRQIVDSIQRVLKPDRNFDFWKDDDEFYRDRAKARRPYYILDTSKLQAAGVKIRPVREALDDTLQNWRPKAADGA